MSFFGLIERASFVSGALDFDRVIWDSPYKAAVVDFLVDNRAAGISVDGIRPPAKWPRASDTPVFPEAMGRMMTRLHVDVESAWRASSAQMRKAARACNRCPDFDACCDMLPEPLSICRNYEDLRKLERAPVSTGIQG